MNTLQHTPGPWKAFNSKKGRIFKHWQVDTGTGSVTLDDAGHWEAGNAHLIAAAPELYAALEAYHFHFGPLEDNYMLHPDARNCMKLAIAALAKARGESQ